MDKSCYCCGARILPGRGWKVTITNFPRPDDPPGTETKTVRRVYCSKKCADWNLGIHNAQTLNPEKAE